MNPVAGDVNLANALNVLTVDNVTLTVRHARVIEVYKDVLRDIEKKVATNALAGDSYRCQGLVQRTRDAQRATLRFYQSLDDIARSLRTRTIHDGVTTQMAQKVAGHKLSFVEALTEYHDGLRGVKARVADLFFRLRKSEFPEITAADDMNDPHGVHLPTWDSATTDANLEVCDTLAALREMIIALDESLADTERLRLAMNDFTREIAALVDEQGAMLDQIEPQPYTPLHVNPAAVAALQQAMENQRRARRKLYALVAAFALILLVGCVILIVASGLD